MSQKSKNKLSGGLAVVLSIVIVLLAALLIDKYTVPTSTFTDGLGQQQTISSFDDCMDWVMPWEEINGVMYCYAPGDVEFSDGRSVRSLGIALSIFLAVFVVFQALLAVGRPYGEAAWGGQKGKVLPANYRIASVASSLFFVFSILVVLSKIGVIGLVSSAFADTYLWFLTGYLGLGTVMNAISRSKKERLWTPVVAVMFALCLMLMI